MAKLSRADCPYLNERFHRFNIDHFKAAPPDSAELYQHLNTHLAEQMQSRRSTGADAPVRCLPSDLVARDHFLEASLSASPLASPASVSQDLEFSHARHSAESLENWRVEQYETHECLILIS